MELFLNDKKIGKIYSNIEISKDQITGSYSDILTQIREGGFIVSFGNKKIKITSYRKHWLDREHLHLEGSVFEIL